MILQKVRHNVKKNKTNKEKKTKNKQEAHGPHRSPE
jgi:hypothetical protein